MDTITAFLGDEAIATGSPADVARQVEARHGRDPAVRAYDDVTGRVLDLDFEASPEEPRGRGRPKLGVVAREVTLLPRQWEWLSAQPGGASGALRRLVETARVKPPSPEARRDAAYRFMSDRCGDLPGYEEALRALYRGETARFGTIVAPWPEGVRAYIVRLLG
jgi:hypothetical protein